MGNRRPNANPGSHKRLTQRELKERKRQEAEERAISAQNPTTIDRTGNMSSKKLATIVAGIATALAAIGVTVYLGTKDPEPSEQSPYSPPVAGPASPDTKADEKPTYGELAERGWTLIHRIEGSLSKYNETFGAKIRENANNPVIAYAHKILLDQLESNKNNKDRNYVDMLLRKVESIQAGYFSYLILEATEQDDEAGTYTVASYSSLQKSISISENFDPNDFIDWSALIHEETHSIDDMLMNVEYDLGRFPAYEKILNNPGPAINSEVKAHVLQIEFLNAVTDNYIQEVIEQGESILTHDHIDVIINKLGLKASTHFLHSVLLLEDLLKLAQVYYANGGLVAIENHQYRVPEALYTSICQRYFQFNPYVYYKDGTALNLERLTPENYRNYVQAGTLLEI